MGIRTRTSSITFEVAPPPVAVVSYATWDVGSAGAGYTFSGGNLVATHGAALSSVRSSIGKAAGKWYWEITNTTDTAASNFIGVCDAGFDNTTYPGNFAKSGSWQGPADQLYLNGFTLVGTRSLLSPGTVMGFAVDLDAGKLWVHFDGAWALNDPTGAQAITIAGFVGSFYACVVPWASSVTANFGASAFGYSVPAGFNAGVYT